MKGSFIDGNVLFGITDHIHEIQGVGDSRWPNSDNNEQLRTNLRKLVRSHPVNVQAAALYLLVQSPLEFACLMIDGNEL
jgi:hypothetical protein